MSWVTNRIDLGTIRERSTIRFKFESLYPLDIELIKPGCKGCTKVGKYKDNSLPITYTPSSIPKHIIKRPDFKFQPVTKTVKIRYKNGQEETLFFTAKIIK